MSTEEAKGTYENNSSSAANGGAAGPKTAEPNLADELHEFGNQLVAVLRATRESARTKDLEQQVTSAMKDVEKQVNESWKAVKGKVQPGNVPGTIKGTATTAADEVQAGLARGMRGVNERLAKMAKDAETSRAKAPADAPRNE